MSYQLPEPPELKFTLQYNEALITEYGQACYQAGEDRLRALLTSQSRAYDSGYQAGRDSMKAEAVKVCEGMKTVSGEDDVERGFNAALRRSAEAIKELK